MRRHLCTTTRTQEEAYEHDHPGLRCTAGRDGITGWGECVPYPRYGDTQDSVTAQIAALLGPACRASDILYSTRILKKTGLRLTEGGL